MARREGRANAARLLETHTFQPEPCMVWPLSPTPKTRTPGRAKRARRERDEKLDLAIPLRRNRKADWARRLVRENNLSRR